VEAVGNVAIGITPHIDVTGGLAYGMRDNYLREQVDARLCATDAYNRDFNIWLGAGWYWSKHPSDGLDEAAIKAGLGWRPFKGKPLVFGLTEAQGIKSGRRCTSVSLQYALKMTKGVSQ
jgi:hypothetical protein